MGFTRLCTCSAAMADPFCVGAGRRLPGSSKSGPGKDGSRNEVRLPVRHDPPKLGKWGQAKVSSELSWLASAAWGPPPCTPSSWWPGGPPGLRAFPGWAQPGALDSCSRLTVPYLLCLSSEGSKTHSRPDQASGWREAAGSTAAKAWCVLCCRVASGPGWAVGAQPGPTLLRPGKPGQ